MTWWSRRGQIRRSLVAAFGLSSLLASLVAQADPPSPGSEPVHLRYDLERGLTSSCPGRERFVSLVRAQRPNFAVAPPEEERARTFDVSIRRDGARLEGSLTIVERDGSTSRRAVQAPSCSALVSALAVVSVLAIDEGPQGQDEEPATELPASDEPLSPPPPVEPPAAPSPSPRPRPPRPELSPRRPAPAVAMLGLGGELVLGPLPRSAVGYRAYFEIEKKLHELMLGGRFSLAFAHAQLPDTAKLNIFIQTWTARLEACGARELVQTLWVQACVGSTLGVYHSYSTQVVNADDQLRPWFTLNAGGRVRWFPAGPAFFTELYGTAAYAATSYDTVARDGSGAGHLVPRLIGEVGIGLGHSFDFP